MSKIEIARNMKHRDFTPCIMCRRGVMHCGAPIFFRINMDHLILNLDAIKRAHGMEMMMGGNAAIANALGADEDLTTVINGNHDMLICGKCAHDSLPPYFWMREDTDDLASICEREAKRTHPIRIQRRRTRGWRMPERAVYVGRPSKWGNPYIAEHPGEYQIVVDEFKDWWIALEKKGVAHDISELKGKTLVCWCPLNRPCHADFLLEIANEKT